MKISKRLEGIGEYYFSQKLREIDGLNKQGKNIINLGIGSPDLPPHPEVIKVLQDESAKPNVHAYQNYKGSPLLRKAMADWYSKWYSVTLNPDSEILPLIGSKEGIMHICMTYIEKGDMVLVPNPGYPTYRSAAKLAEGKLVEYHLTADNHWLPDWNEIKKLLSTERSVSGQRKTVLMFVNYPHMPTGQLPTEKLFEQLISFAAEQDILICHDNPYSFILNEVPMSILSVPGAKDHAIELNSLSKSQNMAGWRVGMLLGSAQRIEEILRFKSNMDSGMFLPLQLAAVKALSLGKEWYESVNNVYRQRRSKAFELLNSLGCVYETDQAGMFVWARIPSDYKDSYAMSDEILYNADVFITPGGIFGSEGNNYLRVSLCSPEEKISESLARITKARVK